MKENIIKQKIKNDNDIEKISKLIKKEKYIPFKSYTTVSESKLTFKKDTKNSLELKGLNTVLSSLLKKMKLGVIDFDGRNKNKIPEFKNVSNDYDFNP